MHRSLVGATYDLLAFAHRGDFGKFDRCFTKACAFFSLSLDDRARRKLRNLALWYLRDDGYLDVCYTESSTSWSTAPATLVQRAEGDFVLIGGSTTAEAVRDAAPEGSLRSIRSADGGLVPGGGRFFPDILQLTGQDLDIAALGRRAQVSVCLSYQAQIFGSLPSLRSILDKGVARDDDIAPFEPESTGRLDFVSGAWLPYTEPRAFESGLYRRSFDYGPAKYVIATDGHSGRLTTFHVVAREWALVAALALLRLRLPLRYDRVERRLSVPRKFRRSLRMPTLLERCFRSGTLLNPLSVGDSLAYDGITYTSVRRLEARLPLFSIEVSS